MMPLTEGAKTPSVAHATRLWLCVHGWDGVGTACLWMCDAEREKLKYYSRALQ